MVITERDKRGRIAKGSNFKHGLSSHAIYDCWIAMKARCSNRHHPNYKNYGGRGVKVLWGSFEEFYEDMGDDYHRSLTIDRVNNNGDYCKENCRWISIQDQQKNRSDNNESVGVRYEPSRKKWRADICRKGKKYFLGRFKDKEEAVNARGEAELKLNICS